MLDDELRALLAVDPPPALVARVRARVGASVPRALWWRLPVVAVGVTTAVAVAVIAAWLVSVRPTEPSRHTVTERSDPSAAGPRTPLPESVAPVVVSAAPVRAVLSRRQQAPLLRSSVFPLPATAPLIDDAEARALHQLFTSGAVVDSGPPVRWADEIVIAPLIIEPLTPATAADEDLPRDTQGSLPPGEHR